MQLRRIIHGAGLVSAALVVAVACAKSEEQVSGSGGSDAGTDSSVSGGQAGGGAAGTSGSTSGGGTAGAGGSAGASGSGGVAGAAGAAGAAGSAGAAGTDAGSDAGCSTANDCPTPSNECDMATCAGGVCGTAHAAAGALKATQTPGDCKKLLCDGSGGTVTSNDDTDVPDDGKACTTDGCSGGVAFHNPLPSGTSCGTALYCDSAGNCAGCSTASDCAGQDTECAKRTCTSGVCGMSLTAAGTKLAVQTSGDCKVIQCDGNGSSVTVADNSDVPVDGKQCTSDLCTAGVPSNPNSPSGTSCSENGGTVCNGAGTCTGCLTAANCPGADTDCAKRTCSSGVCGVAYTVSGTPTTSQVTGDCKTNVCDGAGGVTTTTDASDVPVDGNQCTNDLCSGSTPSNPPLTSGTSCSQSGGKLCNGSGQCVECLTGADCTSGICQNNGCTTGGCGSGTVDCDGLSSNGCECSGNVCCGSACMPQHQNGLGQTYDDCAPLGVPGNQATYSVTMAGEARAAWPTVGTDGAGKCTGPNGGDALFRQTASSCAVWLYTGSAAGHVHLNTASNSCVCASGSDPTWT